MKLAFSSVLLACTALAAAVPQDDHKHPARGHNVNARALANTAGPTVLKLPTALPYNTARPVSRHRRRRSRAPPLVSSPLTRPPARPPTLFPS